MNNLNTVLKNVGSGVYDAFLADLYGKENMTYQRHRIIKTLNEFENQFGPDRFVKMFSAPGKIEICGSHTDHQQGNVLAAAVNMDTLAVVSPNDDGVIRVKSASYPMDEVAVSLTVKSNPNEYSPLGDVVIADLDPYPEEEHKSIALIRGIAAKFYLMGKTLKGFDCYTTSDIIKDAGLSSSAAFEVLIGCILNSICMDDSVTMEEIAEIGQFAENYYFKKDCSHMDNLTCALGGIRWIDFYDSDTPFITNVDFDFKNSGYTLCILRAGKGKNINAYEQNAIMYEMQSVANFFGKNTLSRVDESEFLNYLKDVRIRCGDRAVLRAWHFFEEDKRAVRCAKLLQKNNIKEFLSEISRSGRSSYMYLQNACISGSVSNQSLPIAMANCERLLGSNGAFRIHGIGFDGSVQAFVPNDMLEYFKSESERLLGKGSCHLLKIRRKGCVELGGNNV